MEKDQKQNDMLDAYAKATDLWAKSFQAMQEQATSAFKLYIQGFEQALKSSNFEEMKKYNEIWQNMAKQFEQNPYQWSQKAWEDLWKESGFVSFKAFFDNWQNVWKNFAKDAEAKSKEALDKIQKQAK
ncbi:hypothetical protein [Candidatus Nitrosotenuis aquarius]|jgi:hypothetical protein|uniref:hypothetical protein n=1 Tax=Candidatus Nitrosotenuis aquarius TaxID=1846278 RepID=UPI000C1EABE7|nr:hypothetical protein [Candidatus Nitrosotenuis aquarius]